MRRLGAFVVLLTALVVGQAPEVAVACSCRPQGATEQVVGADVVFVGEVVAEEPVPGADRFDPFGVRTTFAVERVYAGAATESTVVLSGEASTGACEYAFEEGRYLVFATEDDDGALGTSLCSGTTRLDADEAVPAELGAGSAPTSGGADPPDEDPPDDDPADAEPVVPEDDSDTDEEAAAPTEGANDDEGSDTPVVPLVLGGAVLAAAAVGGVALILARRPRR